MESEPAVGQALTAAEKPVTPGMILKVSLPLVAIFATLGQNFVGRFLLSLAGVTNPTTLDIGENLYEFSCTFVLLLVIPWWIATKKWGVKLAIFGTQRGNWRIGKILLIISPIAIVVMYFAIILFPTLDQTYPMSRSVLTSPGWFVAYEALYGLLYYIPYEFHFRGFLQLGLSNKWKPIWAILLVTAVTTVIHWDKPTAEITGAFAVGFFFGYLAYKAKSWTYIWWIHFLIGMSTDIFCALLLLGVITAI
jgi:membrane protease YdiL (CAAX protease family)